MRVRNRLVSLGICVASLGGCTVPKEIVPFIAGDGTKVALLQQSVRTLKQALEFGDPSIAQEVVSPVALPGLYKTMVGDPKSSRVASVTADDVDLKELESGKASVVFEVQAYATSNPTVQKRVSSSDWEFSRVSGGWTLTAVKVKDPIP